MFIYHLSVSVTKPFYYHESSPQSFNTGIIIPVREIGAQEVR